MSPLEPRRYSERLGVIEPDQLYAVAGRFGLGDVTDAHLAPGGLFGQNIILTTSEGGFVLRGNPHGHVQLTKERRVAELIHERSSLPAPWPYEVCDDDELFGWTYAVMPLLPGTSGSTLWDDGSPGDRVPLARATGEALAKLHEATSDAPGPYDAQLDDFIEVDEFADWALHRLDHWRAAARSVNALSTEAELFIDELIDECAYALDEPFQPVLVHHDFKPGNLNFERTEGGFDTTGVFDLFEAYLADGEEDLVRMLWTAKSDAERDAFVEAYVSHHPLRPGASERLALYALSDWLVMWEYGRRHGVWFEDTTFVESVRPIIANARAVGSRHS